jgi:hypothetical protein
MAPTQLRILLLTDAKRRALEKVSGKTMGPDPFRVRGERKS